MQILQNQPKLLEVQHTLSKNNYFSKGPLPGFADAVIFKMLYANYKYPSKKMHPHFYHWYIIMRQFSLNSINKWIQEKLYIQTQSQKCIALISQIFLQPNSHPFRIKDRKKSLEVSMNSKQSDPKKQQKQKLSLIDLNSPISLNRKAQYVMIVQIRAIENMQELFNRFYQLKIKLKQLTYHKKQKHIYVRFSAQPSQFQNVRKEIQKWNQVRHVISKAKNDIESKRRLLRTVSIR